MRWRKFLSCPCMAPADPAAAPTFRDAPMRPLGPCPLSVSPNQALKSNAVKAATAQAGTGILCAASGLIPPFAVDHSTAAEVEAVLQRQSVLRPAPKAAVLLHLAGVSPGEATSCTSVQLVCCSATCFDRAVSCCLAAQTPAASASCSRHGTQGRQCSWTLTAASRARQPAACCRQPAMSLQPTLVPQ